MTLYKYLHPDRIDVLANRLIRFSQPADLNDPHEGAPQASSQFTHQLINEEVIPILDQLSAEDFVRDGFSLKYDQLPNLQREAVSRQDFIEQNMTSIAHIMPDLREFYVNQVKQHADQAGKLKDELSRIMSKSLNSKFGVLSLSEDPLLPLMWGHYADGDRGFVIGFDSDSDFFNPDDWKSLSKPLQAMNYSDEKPELAERGKSEENDSAMLFTKPACWSGEREWRALRRLDGATRVVAKSPYDICLFSFPASAVVEVVLGARFEAEAEKHVRMLLQGPDFAHVRLRRVRLSGFNRSLEDA
ncbi:MAG: DUF2971 domain-containing protein [Methanoregulaceae archaeon]|nr:DUF2971 domain-containing protein [Methanoregulaceae archaeon]